MSRLGGEASDEAALLAAYDAHLQLLENRPKTTADTYRSHVKGFLRYLATAHPSVALSGVIPFHVRAWLLHEATRGIAPITRSNDLFALRSFYRFLIAEGLNETNPAVFVTLPSPVQSRVEFYSDPEADAIIEWASAQPGLRWQVGRVLLLTLRYSGLRAGELVNLRTEEVDLDARRISLVGKGRKPRVIPIPTCWRTCSGSTWTKYGPSSRRPRTCSPTPGATGASVVVTGLGRCTTWSWRRGLRREWPVGTLPTGGATPMPRASCAGARTSTSSSV